MKTNKVKKREACQKSKRALAIIKFPAMYEKGGGGVKAIRWGFSLLLLFVFFSTDTFGSIVIVWTTPVLYCFLPTPVLSL